MGTSGLHCIFLGKNKLLYSDLAEVLNRTHISYRIKQVSPKKTEIEKTLKSLKDSSLIFISDDSPFPLELLSDLIWQNASDAIVIILSRKTQTTSLKTPFNNTQFAKIHFDCDSKVTLLFLQYLIQTVKLKSDFRLCKRLLGVSEKRNLWLVDSSRMAIAYISRDVHLYANTAYLKLFNLKTNSKLHSFSVKDFIAEDEYQLYESFFKNQLTKIDIGRSLTLSMRTKNNSYFRARINIIPTVYKGRKCFQIWVQKLTSTLKSVDNEENLALDDETILEQNMQLQAQTKIEGGTSYNIDQDSILKQIMRAKSISISAQGLLKLKNKSVDGTYYYLSLKASDIQTKSINELLSSTTESNNTVRQIFWDKVKLSRILQILKNKDSSKSNYLISISEESIQDNSFLDWLITGLNKIGEKASKLTFLLPSQLQGKHRKNCLIFASTLTIHGCKIGLNGFIVSPETVQMLKYLKPDYVCLSLHWTREIEGNSEKEISLSRVIRRLESRQIQVIAPCGYSLEMKRLFVLSGASFCLEKPAR